MTSPRTFFLVGIKSDAAKPLQVHQHLTGLDAIIGYLENIYKAVVINLLLFAALRCLDASL